MSWKQKWNYLVERKVSFAFTIGSIAFGTYYYLRPVSLTSGIYQPLHAVLGFLSGKYLGLLFVALGLLKLIGLIADILYLKLPLYFALLFLWVLMTFCFFVALLNGSPNYLWILTAIISVMSSEIVSHKTVNIRSDVDG